MSLVAAPEGVGAVGSLPAAVLPPPFEGGEVVVQLLPPLWPVLLELGVLAAVIVAGVHLVVLVEGRVLLAVEEGEPVALWWFDTELFHHL